MMPLAISPARLMPGWLTSIVTTTGAGQTWQNAHYTRGPTGRIDQIHGTSTQLRDHWVYGGACPRASASATRGTISTGC